MIKQNRKIIHKRLLQKSCERSIGTTLAPPNAREVSRVCAAGPHALGLTQAPPSQSPSGRLEPAKSRCRRRRFQQIMLKSVLDVRASTQNMTWQDTFQCPFTRMFSSPKLSLS